LGAAGCSAVGRHSSSPTPTDAPTSAAVPSPTEASTSTAVPASTEPPTSRTRASSPTLGLPGACFAGSGFGQVEPPTVYLGGDPTGSLSSIHWSSWGGAEAGGSGIGWYINGNESTVSGSRQPATVLAFDLGTCADHPAYQEIEWYFAGEGHRFDPGHAIYTCATGGPSAGTEVQPYGPWATSTSLFGDIKPVNTLSGGRCTGPSAFDMNDRYAWRCTLQTGAFYDPCFAPGGVMPVTNVTEVACGDSPWSLVTLIKLSERLPSSSWGTPTDKLRHPWAFELVNGDKCGLIEGTGTSMEGVPLNYGCTYGDAAYPTENVEPWTTKYSISNSGLLTALAIATVWS
jgi:hypothetical protein